MAMRQRIFFSDHESEGDEGEGVLNGEIARHRGLGHRQHWEWCKAWHASDLGMYKSWKGSKEEKAWVE